MRRKLLGLGVGMVIGAMCIGARAQAPDTEPAEAAVPAVEAGVPEPEAVPAEANAPGKGIGLIAVGDMDPALMKRIRAFVEENTAIPVQLLETRAPSAESLFDEAVALGSEIDDDTLCVIGITVPGKAVSEHAVYNYDQRTCVINAGALAPEDDDEELYARRLEKVAMRSCGLLFGLESVPMPLSAMYPYQTLDELDSIARGIDPPTLQKLQKIVKGMGVQLTPTSPFAW